MTAPSQWLSVHLLFDGALYGAACDELLLDAVVPEVVAATNRQLVDGWFFVRYESAEDGPHLRVRMRSTSSDRKPLLTTVDTMAGHPLVRDTRFVAYEPELERYGGPVGVRHSEDLFVASSDAAVALLHKATAGDRSSRLGKAVLAQLVLLHVFDPDRRRAAARSLRFADATTQLRARDAERWMAEHRRAFDRQADGLAPYVEHAWSALDEGASLTPELDRFRADLEPVVAALRAACAAGELEVPPPNGTTSDGRYRANSWIDGANWLLPTYLHMMNNRLGVDLREECYLATVVAATLAPSIVQEPPSFEPAGSAGPVTADT